MAVRGTVDAGAGGTLVTSVTGTAFQVTASPTTGAVVVGLPAIVKIDTSLAIGGATIGSNALAVTGTTLLNGVQTINLSTGGATLPTPNTGTTLQIGQADTATNRLWLNSWASNGQFMGQRAGGTIASPAATEAGAAIVSLGGCGYANGAYVTGANGSVTINTINLWSATDRSTQLTVSLTPSGSTTGANAITLTNAGLTIQNTGGVLLTTGTALTNGSAAALGTLTNAPTAGNPTKWVPINDNGTTRYCPCW